MKLDGYKLLRETDSEFHLAHPEHGEFRVPKDHLHFATVSKIQKHFAEGGEVPADKAVMAPGQQVNVRPGSGNPKDDPEALRRVLMAVKKPGYADGGEVTQDEKDAAALLNMPIPGPAPTGQAFLPDDAKAFLADPTAPPPGPLAAPPTTPVMLPNQQPPPLSASPAAQPQPQLDSATAGIDAGTRQAIAGAQAEAKAKQAGFTQQAGIQNAAALQVQQLAQRQQELLTQRSAAAQDLANQVFNQKLDPNNYWETRSTGQKVSAAVGLILGGIGSGLAGGPNHALQVIDKAIDRDIEAQKFNLSQGKNKLAFYMQQTGELSTAMQLAKADALTVAASQMGAAQAQMGASTAGPQAQQAIGEMTVKANQLRQQATMAQMQIEQAKLGMQFQRAQMGMLSDVFSQAGRSGQGEAGITIPPGAEMLLPKEMQETLVRLPGGKVDFARTPKDAEDVRKTQETSAMLRQKIMRYRALQQAHPNGISRVLSPEDYNAAKALHESMLTDLNGLANLNRFTHEEAQVFSGRLPDITEIGRSSASTSKLDELGQELDDKIQASNRAYLKFSGVH